MEDQLNELNKMHAHLQIRIDVIMRNKKYIDKIAIKNNIEIWKQVQNYSNYLISSKGRIRNSLTNKLLIINYNRKGYGFVNLTQNRKAKSATIHRLVAKAFVENLHSKPFVDHINNNRTDNNASNLRFATNEENGYNRIIGKNNKSGVKGVLYHKCTKKWIASISYNGTKKYLGVYKTIEEAKQVRFKKAKELFGEYINACESLYIK